MAGKFFQSFMKHLTGNDTPVGFDAQNASIRRSLTERQLIAAESNIGAKLFGDVAKGNSRSFFCLDESTWIWYEDALDQATGERTKFTTRYEVHDNGVLKVQEGARYSFLEGAELENFHTAVRSYYEQVARDVYRVDPVTGQATA